MGEKQWHLTVKMVTINVSYMPVYAFKKLKKYQSYNLPHNFNLLKF